MSAVPLTAAPRPRRTPVRPPLEVVATRHQRRARPRAVYAIVTIAGVFGILLTQLMLSIVLSDGAYRITALEAQRIELDRSAQILTEDLNVYNAAQNVAANAESLGMVVSTVSPAFLLLSNGTVHGAPSPAGAGEGVLDGRGDLVSNVLLANVPLVTPAAAVDAATAGPGVSSTPLAPGSLPSGAGVAGAAPTTAVAPTGVLPSPVTR